MSAAARASREMSRCQGCFFTNSRMRLAECRAVCPLTALAAGVAAVWGARMLQSLTHLRYMKLLLFNMTVVR